MLGLAAMERPERTILVLPIKPGTSIREEERRKNEAVSLLETYGAHVVASIAFTLKGEDSAFLIGPGQAGELKEDCLFFEADSVCFDCALRPRTQRNLEEVLGLPVMDRNELIIEIFSQRAHSREARLQTALALHGGRLHHGAAQGGGGAAPALGFKFRHFSVLLVGTVTAPRAAGGLGTLYAPPGADICPFWGTVRGDWGRESGTAGKISPFSRG